MNFYYTLLFVFVINFIVQYFFISYLLAHSPKHIGFNLSKVYLSLFIALVAIFAEFILHDFNYNVFSMRSYLIIGFLIVIVIYLYRTQKYVSDKDYLKTLLEADSSQLLIDQHILKNTNQYKITKIVKDDIQLIQDQMNTINQLLETM